ncbi:hypothetical protein CMI37_34170 [Candidatus Pacearchaeota archaeon]|nr:hypothetical protein [Candidatus Pacearchaeota archaeon]|tara:strand:- start:363 stop:857 length:495 start_codon:yes stop_codon:yes gene_type:complete
MAAYAETVTLDHRKAIKLGGSLAVLTGRCNITNYNTTVAEITDITGHFQNDPIVICSGVSESGYLVHWDRTNKGFKAFYPTIAAAAHDHDFVVGSGTIGSNMEIGLDVDTDSGKVEGGTGITAERTLSANTPVATDGAITAAAGTEVANDVDIGEVQFIAVGIV